MVLISKVKALLTIYLAFFDSACPIQSKRWPWESFQVMAFGSTADFLTLKEDTNANDPFDIFCRRIRLTPGASVEGRIPDVEGPPFGKCVPDVDGTG